VAYRFLLEVPESRVDEANIVVGSTDDAQVVVVRNSHGLGFDDPYSDLTIAAHTLRVIGAIYDWHDNNEIGALNLHLVLHSGQRLNLADFDRGAMVAAIRRDQPWVERTLPRIGDHYRDILPPGDTRIEGVAPQPAVILKSARDTAAPIVTATRELRFLTPARVEINVTELGRAERYYVDFLGADLLGRDREDAEGLLHEVERDYQDATALVQGTEADFSYLANGPVQIALERVGRGARLQRNDDGPIRLTVDRQTFLKLKGDALMRGMEIVSDQPAAFAVRDIYGLVWLFQESAETPTLA
jgi:hypothetical protein